MNMLFEVLDYVGINLVVLFAFAHNGIADCTDQMADFVDEEEYNNNKGE